MHESAPSAGTDDAFDMLPMIDNEEVIHEPPLQAPVAEVSSTTNGSAEDLSCSGAQRVRDIITLACHENLRQALKKRVMERGYKPTEMVAEFGEAIPGNSVETRINNIRTILRGIFVGREQGYIKSADAVGKDILKDPHYRDLRILIISLVETYGSIAAEVFDFTRHHIVWPVKERVSLVSVMNDVIRGLVNPKIREKKTRERHAEILRSALGNAKEASRRYLAQLGIHMFTNAEDRKILRIAAAQRKRKGFRKHDHQEIADAINRDLTPPVERTALMCRRRFVTLTQGAERSRRRREKAKAKRLGLDLTPPTPSPIAMEEPVEDHDVLEKRLLEAARRALGIKDTSAPTTIGLEIRPGEMVIDTCIRRLANSLSQTQNAFGQAAQLALNKDYDNARTLLMAPDVALNSQQWSATERQFFALLQLECGNTAEGHRQMEIAERMKVERNGDGKADPLQLPPEFVQTLLSEGAD